MKLSVIGLLLIATLSACAPEVGSYEWCESVAHSDRAKWSQDQIDTFAEKCVVK